MNKHKKRYFRVLIFNPYAMKLNFTLPLIISLFFCKASFAQVNVQDSLALVDLYNSTDGKHWTNQDNWLTSKPINTWYGVGVVNKRVDDIILIANNLSGKIPESFGKLSELVLLSLKANKISNGLNSLNGLGNLKYLDLSENQITDTLPEFLSELSNLKTLNLFKNHIYGSIPSRYGELIELQDLILERNNLTGNLPQTLGKLPKIQVLDLAINQLTGNIPSEMGSLIYLKELYLNNNLLTGSIPKELGNLSFLQDMDLSNNSLTGNVPSSFSNLISLDYLKLNNNQLSGSFSSEFANLAFGHMNAQNIRDSLFILDISNNQFTFLGVELIARTYKSIHFPISSKIVYYPQANIKIAQKNGWLSVSVGGTPGNNSFNWYKDGKFLATYLQASDFQPTENGKYYVEAFNIQAMNLVLHSDTVSIENASIEDSLALVDLYNSTNGENWSKHTNWLTNKPLRSWYGVEVINNRVDSLLLPYNNLVGVLPNTIGNLSSLKYLILWNNKLSGNIPASIGNLSNLEYLSLWANKFSGNIPDSLSKLAKLKLLTLDGNQLSGDIPASLGNLTRLVRLTMSQNLLTGNMPVSLGNLANLETLGLGNNNLSGHIPESLGNLLKLKELGLSSTGLSGEIPSSFKNLSSLTDAYLNYNQLSGTIPEGFASLKNLRSVYIDHNKFTFAGLEELVKTDSIAYYSFQAPISINYKNGILKVSAGGTISNNTYRWYRNGIADTTISGDSSFIPTSTGNYSVAVTNSIATKLTLLSDTISFGGTRIISPSQSNTIDANREFTNVDGWTDYYYDNNTSNDISDDTLLLSLKKNGENIGSIGDGTFAVKIVATKDAGNNKGIFLSNPLITNSSGYWVMNRYWQVTPSSEPVKSIGVRFYYNNQDLRDVNGSYPTHNLTNQELIMYKAVDGNPDPTTNLAGATKIISIMPGDIASDTTWTYHQLTDTTQYAEYSVSSFSGGGGGGTGNNKSLPVTLVNFTANLNNSNAVLNWQTVTEINSSYFNVQRSLDGKNFTNIAKINAAGNSSLQLSYTHTDPSVVKMYSGKIYYRLVEADKDGSYRYSKIISLELPFADKYINILPNPVHDILQIQLNKFEGNTVISIYDIKGKKLQSKEVKLTGNQNIYFNVASLASGIYLLKVSDAVEGKTLRFIKQ